MKRTIIPASLLLVTLGLLLCGCNLFDWAGDASSVQEGQYHLRQGEYAEAAADFQVAIDEDPLNSDALYGHAKAVMHGSGNNALTIASDLSDSTLGTDDPLPFLSMELAKAEKLFQAVKVVVLDLQPISEGRTHGTFDADDIALDYGIALAIEGILQVRDLNRDGAITADDPVLPFVLLDGGMDAEWEDFIAGGGDLDDLIDMLDVLGDNLEDALTVIIELLADEYGIDVGEINSLLEDIEFGAEDLIAEICLAHPTLAGCQ